MVVLALTLWRSRGPDPRRPDGSAFSAERAKKSLQAILVEGIPHPVGTPANERVRSRIETQFRALGYITQVQSRFACNAYATCGQVENIYAFRRSEPDTVVATAHYDSVGAGIGASDDGMGVAALLEAARVLRDENTRNPIAFLITDGEEAGLLGAEAFVADPVLSQDVGVVVNIEMRGTRGVSRMFETSTGNRWLIRHLATALPFPQATSFSYAVYNLLPNDTDVTIFKRAGKAALNFAAVQGVNSYHTPLDDLAHLSGSTLQHHGDNLVESMRALANADLAARSRTDATYFDLLGWHLVWWPQEWTLWMAIISLVLLMIAARKQRPREVTFGVLTAFAAIVLAVLLGIAIAWIARLKSVDVNFVAHPLTSIAAMWLAGIAAAFFAAAAFRRFAKAEPMLYGVAIVWHAIGIALAFTLPGAAFLFVVPAMFVTLFALPNVGEAGVSAVASAVAAILLFPIALALYDSLGGGLMVAIAVLIGILSTLFTPLWPRPRNALIALILAAACALAAMMQPASDEANPRRISLAHIDDATPQWFVGDMTPRLRQAARFNAARDEVRGSGHAAPAARVAARVAMTATRNGDKLTIRVRSNRHADRLTLWLKGDARVLRVNGVAPAARPARFRERHPRGVTSAIASGVQEMVVECSARGSVQAIAGDLSFGFPASGAALVEARNASNAVPSQDGDVTITRARATY